MYIAHSQATSIICIFADLFCIFMFIGLRYLLDSIYCLNENLIDYNHFEQRWGLKQDKVCLAAEWSPSYTSLNYKYLFGLNKQLSPYKEFFEEISYIANYNYLRYIKEKPGVHIYLDLANSRRHDFFYKIDLVKTFIALHALQIDKNGLLTIAPSRKF